MYADSSLVKANAVARSFTSLCLMVFLLVAGLALAPATVSAQVVPSDNFRTEFPKEAQINSRTTVITQIQIESLQDLIIEDEDGTLAQFTIDPKEDFNASIIRVEGQRNLPVRINFPESMTLFPEEQGVGGTVTMEYRLSWNTVQDQRGSTDLVDINEEMEIGEDGNLYIWVGGVVDISEARVGVYAGDFFVEVEYL